MKKLVRRFGKLITASFIVMGIGVIAFLITPLLYGLWGIDTDVLGLIIITTGLAICIIGIIRRKKLYGWKFAVLSILATVLYIPILFLIVGLIYFLTTGKPLG